MRKVYSKKYMHQCCTISSGCIDMKAVLYESSAKL